MNTGLPTIEEQATVTKAEEDKHKSITEVFPDQRVPSQRLRHRNTSDSNKGTPLKTFPRRQSGGIPRNSTAPNFVDITLSIPRNSSTPGFGRLAVLHGSTHENDQTVFGIPESQLYSNTTLHLQPQAMPGRRNSRPTIRPMYRKDVFYAGSVAHLVNAPNEAAAAGAGERRKSGLMSAVPSYANFDEYRHSVISIPRSRRQSAVWSSSQLHRGSIVASHLSIPR